MTEPPNTKSRRGEGRVTFLFHIEEFRELLTAGHGQIVIYENFGGRAKLGMSYSQFSRYINRYIKGKKEERRQRSSRKFASSTLSDPL
ncbi:conjugal transfer protein TraK [Bartonella australis AUST/NH1]|uniref:Conjugal transfer protein TraK n=1 Tax=Bartonella australis (strain Aust/NH1) TaxID=1094489 RepID=M1NRI3_BARAA|nr:TraK family protein [Bartonella australis]AGF73943.1 conjugal transfer protein TraK [Bartonella australis AUST/NH1]